MPIIVVPKEELPNYVGHKFEPGQWIEIAQERINQFADCTEDFQFIHIDEEKAAQTPFGGTIAHGFFDALYARQDVRGKCRGTRGCRDGNQLRFRQNPLFGAGSCGQARSCAQSNRKH